jgi:hypothetical protein
MDQSVPKRRHIKFRRRRITQTREYNKLRYGISLICTLFKDALNKWDYMVSNVLKVLGNELERLRQEADTVKLRYRPGTSLGRLTLTMRLLYKKLLARSDSTDKTERIV